MAEKNPIILWCFHGPGLSWKPEVRDQKQAQGEEEAGSWALGAGSSGEFLPEAQHRWVDQVFESKYLDVLFDQGFLCLDLGVRHSLEEGSVDRAVL